MLFLTSSRRRAMPVLNNSPRPLTPLGPWPIFTRKMSPQSLSYHNSSYFVECVFKIESQTRCRSFSCCPIVVPDDIIFNFSMWGRIKTGPRHNYPARVKSEIFTFSPTSNLSIYLLPIAASLFKSEAPSKNTYPTLPRLHHLLL